MPTYSYRCADCGHAFDIHQSFTDDNLTICPNCGGTLRKIFSPVGVSFSGSGFYRNDSRAESKPGSSSGSKSEGSKSEGSKSDAAAKSDGAAKSESSSKSDSASSTSKSESKPAPKKEKSS